MLDPKTSDCHTTSIPLSTAKPFDIRDWVDFDKSGRAACPSCLKDNKNKKNLSVEKSTGAYCCHRGCTSTEIRDALGVGKSCVLHSSSLGSSNLRQPVSQTESRSFSQGQVKQSQLQLKSQFGELQNQALAWLGARGFSRQMIEHYQMGLEQWRFAPDETKPQEKKSYWAIALHIPAEKEGQFYRKLRIAPWLSGDERPKGLPPWNQLGMPTTIFYTHRPQDAEATWFCEGEWDAIRLGWLAQQSQTKIAVCCSTTGCNTVPKQEQLNQLPGIVTIFFDRNDQPTKDGKIPGEDGAKKLAGALGDRARIAQVPMPDSCEVKGWDVSDALAEGYSWADFEAAAAAAVAVQLPPETEERQPQVTLRDRLQEILDHSHSAFEKHLALLNLAQATKLSFREIESLLESLKLEQAAEFDQSETVQKLTELLQNQPTKLDLNRYLEPWFADCLLKTARAMPTAPEFLFTTLLSAAASRIGTSARIVIKASAKYVQPMVIWTAIASKSGSMKSPSQQIIVDPLAKLDKEAYEVYLAEQAEHQIEGGRGKCQDNAQEKTKKSPIRRRFIFNDATLETLQRIHAENPRGLLGYCDELAGAIKMRNAYRRGHGGDEEAELSQWNGSAVIVDRAERSVCLPCTAISRTGSIQWEVLAELMGNHQDANGAWSRWLICAADAPPRYINLLEEDQDTGISEALTKLYIKLSEIPPQDYSLSLEAKQLFQTWQHQLVDAQRAENSTGLQLVYPKIEAYTARLALWLNIVNAVLRCEEPTQIISGKTMERAIELAAYYLWQSRLIHLHNSPDSGLAAIALKIQKFAQRIGGVTASRLKSGIRDLRKTATNQIRQLMQALAQAGYGCVEGQGTEMVYLPSTDDPSSPKLLPTTNSGLTDTVDNSGTGVSAQKTQARQDFQPAIDSVDAVQELNQSLDSGGTQEPANVALVGCHNRTHELPQSPGSTGAEIEGQHEPIPIEAKHEISDQPRHESSIIHVGDICRYVGTSLKLLRGLDHVVVEAINGTNVDVQAPGWYISNTVPIADLVKLGR